MKISKDEREYLLKRVREFVLYQHSNGKHHVYDGGGLSTNATSAAYAKGIDILLDNQRFSDPPASNGEAVVERVARADGLSQALEILEEYEGVQGAKIKIVAAINAIRENQS